MCVLTCFICKNPAASRKDSVVTERINYDLLKKIAAIQAGDLQPTELLGSSNNSKTKDDIPPAISKHACPTPLNE